MVMSDALIARECGTMLCSIGTLSRLATGIDLGACAPRSASIVLGFVMCRPGMLGRGEYPYT